MVDAFRPLEGLSLLQSSAFVAFVILSVPTNVLWYRVKFLLRRRGYPMSHIHHFQDLRHLNQLIATAPPDVQRLRRLRCFLYASLVATLGAFACFFGFFVAGV
jgi:hypothetical protein